jgi:altronate dehydratase
MDINAGRYLDGESMESLTAEYLDLVIATASGQRTKGEHAGHSQTSLWRNWRQTDRSQLDTLRARPAPAGVPLVTAQDLGSTSRGGILLQAFQAGGRFATERVGLVLPTSLCSAQISRLAADRLNAKGVGREQGISRFVALMHTEGCGFGGEAQYKLLNRTYQGYIQHPNVAAALLLEHGCEKIPNDVVRHQLGQGGVPLERFGWASVQLDGGIEKALANVEQWFRERFAALPPALTTTTDLGALSLGIMTAAPVTAPTATALAAIARNVVASGGSVLIPESDALLANDAFRRPVLGNRTPKATLAYGQPLTTPGFHVVATETDHWVENVTGLGGCGAHLILGVVAGHAQQGHPLVPVIQVAETSQRGTVPGDDIDLFLAGDATGDEAALAKVLVRVAQREQIPAALAQGAVDFQLTRGLLGVTT